MSEEGAPDPERRARLAGRRETIGLLGILVLAGALRLVALPACLPYLSYIDEGHILHPVMRVLVEGGWDRGWVHYPSLLINTTALVARIERPLYDATHDIPLRGAIPEGAARFARASSTYDLVGPPGLVLLARAVVLAFGTLLVAATWALARAVLGPAAGLWAALLAAAMPALVTRSSIVIVDTPAAFFAAAALLASVRLLETNGPSAWISLLAGALSGLAFTTKYPSGAVAFAVGAALALGPARRAFLRHAALAAAGFVAAALISMPLLLRSPGVVLRTLRAESLFYSSYTHSPGYLAQALLPGEVGLPVALLAAAGLLVLLLREEKRRVLLVFLAFALPFALSFAWAPFKPFRNALPLLPLACVAAGAALFEIRSSVTPRGAGLAASLAIGLPLAGWSGYQSWKLQDEAATRSDSRIEAVDWLLAHATSGQRLLVAAEAGILPSELRRLPATVEVLPMTDLAAALERADWDLLVAPPVAIDQSPDAAHHDAYRSVEAALTGVTPVFTCGENPVPPFLNYWRGNREKLVVLEHPPRSRQAVGPASGG